MVAGEIVEIGADVGIGVFIGLDREVAGLEVGGPEMFGVGQWCPGEKILRAFRHVRNHFEQHDGFVEMIQVVGGEPGAGIDVGGAQLLRARLVYAALVGGGIGRSDRASVAAVKVICPTVNIGG